MTYYIYIFTIFAPFFLFLIHKIKNVFNLFYFSYFIYLCLFIGLRDYVGPDWYVYITIIQDNFNNYSFEKIFFQREPIPALIGYISSYFNLGIYGIFFFYSFTTLIIYFSFLNKLDNYNKIFYIIFSLPFLIIFLNINSPRQAFAIAIIFYLINCNYIINKKIFLKIIFLIVAILSHNSSIIIIPLIALFFIFDNNFNKKNILNSLILISLVLFLLLYFILPEVWYYVNSHFLKISLNSTAYYFRTIYFFPYMCLSIYIVFQSNLDRKYYLIFLFFISIYFLTFFISSFSTTIADRLNFYIFPFLLIFLTKFLNHFKNFGNIMIISYIFIIYNFLIFFIWLNTSTAAESWIPYKNLLLNFN